MELGSREWYQQALADARGVWEGAPRGVNKSMPHVPRGDRGLGVQAGRKGRMVWYHPPSATTPGSYSVLS